MDCIKTKTSAPNTSAPKRSAQRGESAQWTNSFKGESEIKFSFVFFNAGNQVEDILSLQEIQNRLIAKKTRNLLCFSLWITYSVKEKP